MLNDRINSIESIAVDESISGAIYDPVDEVSEWLAQITISVKKHFVHNLAL